ncbi:MAG: hypothetical protein DYG98_19085 [Haliscomenobacteraceae bacterium CHB4]|nr:hypothetical protein [Saprospiraceae bacterium]MCE7925164.1 hypothetical protein [Haliscomenobacteraceae bacterium CHB4]
MEFVESNLRFLFDEAHWRVTQYDAEKGFYRDKILKSVPGTEAIDFIGIYKNRELALFEVKNLRGYRIQNAPRLANGAEELTLEIARKVRDTMAGFVGGNRNDIRESEFWKDTANLLTNPKREIFIIAWVEEDMLSSYNSKEIKRIKTVRASKLKQKLHWLTSRVSFQNVSDYTLSFEGFNCQFIAGS